MDKPMANINAAGEIKITSIPSFFCSGVSFGYVPGIVRLTFTEDRLTCVGKERQRIEHVDIVMQSEVLRETAEFIIKNLDEMDKNLATAQQGSGRAEVGIGAR